LHTCTATDDLVWVAIYSDQTQLQECNGEADHAFGDIDLERLAYFALVPRSASADPLAEKQHVVKQTPNTRIIFFRRRQIEIAQTIAGGPQQWATIPVLGLKLTVGDRVAKVYQYLMPNGSTLLSDDFAAI
jgi:hypothetical protein